eukprot:Nk52_evm10s1129 gene=Nk52_evmTU10s1129
MEESTFELAKGFVSNGYIRQAEDAKRKRVALFKSVLAQRKMPDVGWPDDLIKCLLYEISLMDSNNFPGNVGVGEREARLYSSLVKERHFSFGHGIGRSGDLCEVQPKAAGSSLIYKITNCMILDLIKHCCLVPGCLYPEEAVVFPLATGMSVVLCLLALKSMSTSNETKKFVIWPRMDQKSCFKAILSAGLHPLVIENVLEGDEARTNIPELERVIEAHGAGSILCVLSTSSCFAPRAPDRIGDIAKVCKKHGIGHVVNNAYGVQIPDTMRKISSAARLGTVDYVIQSTDKNFMVPVGGSVIYSFTREQISFLSKMYPGRASGSGVLDLFITLLSMGKSGFKKLLDERKQNFAKLKEGMGIMAGAYGERLLKTDNNPISFDSQQKRKLTFKNFDTGLSSSVVTGLAEKNIQGYHFSGFGAHIASYPCPYLTAAGAIGMKQDEIDDFLLRLDKVLSTYRKKKVPTKK